MPEAQLARRTRLQVACLSIAAGLAILGLKYWAYLVSGSSALKSDAIESIVNVVAAFFALGAVIFADRPADREHPYGHGKIEHFSAAFEGGLIALAAVIIAWEALQALIHGVELKNLGLGMAINMGAGALNGLLGLFLLRMGRRHQSRALEADGHHVLSDFWTTLGLLAGLLLVRLTNLRWLDPVMAMAVAALLAWTGFKLVRSSSMALLDMEDPQLLARLVEVLNRIRPPELIAVHEMRTLRSGRVAYVDIHLVVPEFFTIDRGHDLVESLGKQVVAEAEIEGELHTHMDPCQRAWCRRCGVEACPLRVEPQREEGPITVEAAVGLGPI